MTAALSVQPVRTRNSVVFDGRVTSKRYDLARLAELPKGSSVKLGRIDARVSTERAFEKELRKLLRGIAKQIRTEILPEYSRRTDLLPETPLLQDGVDDWFANIRTLRGSLTGAAAAAVSALLDAEADRHTKRFTAIIQSQIKVSLDAIVRLEDLTEYMQAATARSVNLIGDLYDATRRRVEQITLAAVLTSKPVNDLRKELQEAMGIASRRATLIAVDQTSTLVSELNQIRQEQAGITKYEWATAGDERVRDLHSSYNGKTYSWDKPPSDGHPGTPIRCRCVALAVLEGL